LTDSATGLKAGEHSRPYGLPLPFIDLSQAECSIHFLGRAVLDYTVNGRVPTRTGNALAEYVPSGVYPCAGTDRWVALAAPTNDTWQGLCEASGEGWAKDQRFATVAARLANREALDVAIGAWTSAFDAARLEDLLQAVGVPVHRVATSADVFQDPQLAARRHIVELEDPRLGPVLLETSRMRLSRTPAAAAWPGPEVGQHNDFVLRGILGMSDEAITELVIDEALE
jgi:benzylsuccinate CoA-transferase BbsF subunit